MLRPSHRRSVVLAYSRTLRAALPSCEGLATHESSLSLSRTRTSDGHKDFLPLVTERHLPHA
jgi:hypothetical protein